MNAENRNYLYERIASGLEHYWAASPPTRFHLLSTGVPRDDGMHLAHALCRTKLPGNAAQAIHTISLDKSENLVNSAIAAIVIDGCSRPISDVERYVNQHPEFPEIIVTVNIIDGAAHWPILRYDPIQMSDVVAEALDELFRRHDRIPSPIARIRFEHSGYDGLLGLIDESEELPRNAKNFENFYHRLGRAWRFNGTQLNANDIAKWVDQFSDAGFESEARQILTYLQQRGFSTEDAVIERLMSIYVDARNSCSGKYKCVSIQESGKSEGKLSYRLRPNIVTQALSDAIVELNNSPDFINFFCFDDCVISGESVTKYLFDHSYNRLADDLSELLRLGRVRIFVIAHDVAEIGKRHIEEHPQASGNVVVKSFRILGPEEQTFSSKSQIIFDPDRRDKFREFCSSVGETLFPGHALGWEDGQLCICYDYTIPDNSIPVLWGRSVSPQEWNPLFERLR